jgi:hypothetical protein
MGRYRKKPVVIEAIQMPSETWPFVARADRMGEIETMMKGVTARWIGPSLAIKTLEGTMTASPGDWIIKGVSGEFYPCKPDIFEATYEHAGQVSEDSER